MGGAAATALHVHVDYVGLGKRFYSAVGEMMATSINYEGRPPVAPEFDAAALRANSGIVFQRAETDDGFDAGLTQTEPTAGGSRLQGAGLHPPALAEPMQLRMFSTEQTCF